MAFNADGCGQAEPLNEDQQAGLLSALRTWEAWIESRETVAPEGFIVYRAAGLFAASHFCLYVICHLSSFLQIALLTTAERNDLFHHFLKKCHDLEKCT